MEPLFQFLNPKQASEFFEGFLTNLNSINPDSISSRVRIEGRGFPPVAVTLGGLMSIGGVIVSYFTFRDYLKYVITSPEVELGQGTFALSHQYYSFLKKRGLKPVIVPFNNLPMYGDAEKLLDVLQEGAVILNGVSAELAVWFGRNSGVGRLMIYRPENGYGVFKYV